MNDEEKNSLLPTRHSSTCPDGGAKGDANERQMRANLADTNSCRTSLRLNADGSTTRLRTRGGWCEYVTECEPTTPEDEDVKVYMESGQLEFTWPGEGNPTRDYPAKWRFLNISTLGDYLGYIKHKNEDIGKQKNKPALFEGMDSLAVGYARKPTTAEDAAARLSLAEATILKKMILSMFPASLYSGKMRAFMQAQYGAKETNNWPFSINAVGSSFTLKYIRDENELTLGLWVHNSPGIFTAPDGTYWLISISATEFSYYPITQDKAGKALLKVYESSVATDRTKLEAYIFAHSKIDLTKKKTFPISGSIVGAPLAYGWKFNSTGTKASIVLHEQVGSFGNLMWYARTYHLTFSYFNGDISASLSSIAHGNWTDGWGAFNIFVPEYDIATRLWCNSIAMSEGAAEKFAFSNVVVYGYYIDDVWEPVVMSRSDAYSGDEVRTETTAGMLFDVSVDFDDPMYQPNWNFGHYVTDASATVSYSTETDSMSISFGGATYNGDAKFGHHEDVTFHTEPRGDAGDNYTYVVGTYGTLQFDKYDTAPGYAEYVAAAENGDFNVGYHVTRYMATMINTSHTYDGWLVNNGWALVIPGMDAEAIYIPHSARSTSATTGTKIVNTSDPAAVTSFWHQIATDKNGGTYVIHAYTPCVYDVLSLPPVITSEAPMDVDVGVACSNTEILNATGVPAGSYYGIFFVAFYYPYYDPGMFFFTSYGGRYIGSEGVQSPSSVRSQDRFVGWA